MADQVEDSRPRRSCQSRRSARVGGRAVVAASAVSGRGWPADVAMRERGAAVRSQASRAGHHLRLVALLLYRQPPARCQYTTFLYKL